MLMNILKIMEYYMQQFNMEPHIIDKYIRSLAYYHYDLLKYLKQSSQGESIRESYYHVKIIIDLMSYTESSINFLEKIKSKPVTSVIGFNFKLSNIVYLVDEIEKQKSSSAFAIIDIKRHEKVIH